MRNKTGQREAHYTPQYSLIPSITTIAIPLLMNRRKEVRAIGQFSQEKPMDPKTQVTLVEKYEISNYVLKFLVQRGFFKKRWVIIQEIPINEIKLVKVSGNELSLTWKGVVQFSVIKSKESSFSSLSEQISSLLKKQQKDFENAVKANKRKRNLVELIDTSVFIVDLSFDMLMALQVKPVDWANLEIYAKSLTEKMILTPQTLVPLNVDFSKITDAIRSQAPEEASKETFNVLNSIYVYFDNLRIEEELEAMHPNIKDAKAAILASFTLNDIFLGKVVGEKDNQKENQALENALKNLSKDTNFKLNYQDFKANFDKIDSDAENESIVESSREIFKEQLRNIDRPVNELSIVQSLTKQTTPQPKPQPFTPPQETQTLPVPQAPEKPQSLESIVKPLETVQPIIELTSIDQKEHLLLPKPQSFTQPAEPQDLEEEPLPQALPVEQEEKMKNLIGNPEVQPQEPAKTDNQIPNNEEIKNNSELRPKKKSSVRRLRKAIMGY